MPAMVFALLIAAAGLPLFGLVRLRLSNHR
jgi:hypothetical protein